MSAALDQLADEWEQLYAASPTATPFLSYGWLRSYWDAFGDAGSLRIATAREPGGELCAGMALRLRRRAGVRVLTPVGAELSDFSDALLEPKVPDAAADLADALLAIPGWDVLDLPQVAPGAALRDLLDVWPGQQIGHPADTCLELPVAPPEVLVGQLPAKARQDLRRQLRKATGLGLTIARVPAEPAALTGAVDQMLDLHARQWAGAPVNRLHLTAGFRRHLTGSALRLAPLGRMALTRYALNGTVLAVSLFLLTPQTVSGYLYGVAPELFRRLDVTALMIRSGLELGRECGATRLAMLRGEEAGKLRWQPRRLRNRRILLLRPRIGRGHAAALVGLALRGGRALVNR